MNVKSVEKLEKSMVALTIEASAAELEAAVDKVYKKQRGKIMIPGFRKGHAPRKIIEAMYGTDVFYEDAVNEIYPDLFAQAAEQEKLDTVAYPEVELQDINKDGFTFKATVAVRPEVTLGDYKGLTAPKETVKVTDKDIDEELKPYIQRATSMKDVDRKAKKGDTVTIDFEGFMDGKAFEGGKAEGHDLELGSGSFIPGFEDQLIGAEKGAEVEVKVQFPAEYHAEDLAGKPAVFKVTVKEIKAKELPALDDDFAQDVSEFDTLAEYKEDVKKNLTEKKEKAARTAKENAAVDKAIENAQMDIPDLMIQTQCRQMMDDFARRMQQQGLSMDQYFQFTGQSMDKMMEDMKPQALKRIQTRLVLEKVAEAENIQPSEEEITEEIQKMADAYKMEADKIREAIGESGLEQMKKDMAVQKAVTVIADAAVEVEKAADAE